MVFGGERLVFVPWRGVSCFYWDETLDKLESRFRPLTGCELFHGKALAVEFQTGGFRPLTGCKLFRVYCRINNLRGTVFVP